MVEVTLLAGTELVVNEVDTGSLSYHQDNSEGVVVHCCSGIN